MSPFDTTVTKLAASPTKTALLPHIPCELTKTADLFGGLKGATGKQKVLQGLAMAIGAATVTGSGALLAEDIRSRFSSMDMRKAQHSEVGKLTAQNTFKTQMMSQLTPSYARVFKKMMQDPVISKADKEMITSAYATMKRFAPNLAADENAARSFLREHAIYGTGPSYASLKNLAEAEQAVAKSGGALL